MKKKNEVHNNNSNKPLGQIIYILYSALCTNEGPTQ